MNKGGRGFDILIYFILNVGLLELTRGGGDENLNFEKCCLCSFGIKYPGSSCQKIIILGTNTYDDTNNIILFDYVGTYMHNFIDWFRILEIHPDIDINKNINDAEKCHK